MKKLLIALTTSLALVGGGAVYAACEHDHDGTNHHSGADLQKSEGSGKGHPGMQGSHGMQFLESKLDLNDEQKKKIHAIFDANKDSMPRPHQGDGVMSLDPNAADYDAQVQRIAKERAAKVEQGIIAHSKVHAQVYAILTPEQRDKMKLLMEKKHDRIQQNVDGERAHK